MMEPNTKEIQKSGVTDISWIIINPYSDQKTDEFEVDGIPNLKWCIKYSAPSSKAISSGLATNSRFELQENLASDSKHVFGNMKIELKVGCPKTVSSFIEITNSLTNFARTISGEDLVKLLDVDKHLNLRLIIKIMNYERKFIDEKAQPNFQSYLINDALSDVILQINNQKFPAHKIVLASASSVFEKMFSHQMLENITNIVQIQTDDLDVFKEMLRFIYSGQINDLGTFAFGLYDIAHEFDVQRLQIICEQFLQESLTLDNVVPILELADRHNSLILKKKCVEYIDQHFDKIGKTEAFKNVKKNLLLEVLYLKYKKSSKNDKIEINN